MEKTPSSSNSSSNSTESSSFEEPRQPISSFKNGDSNNSKKNKPRVVIEHPHFESLQTVNDIQFTNENTPSVTAFMQLKRELSRYKKVADESQIRVLSAETKAKEIESKLTEAKIKIKQYENEINSLKGSSSSPGSKSSVSNTVNINYSLYNDLLENYAQRNKELSETRLQLINICSRYKQCYDMIEKLYCEGQNNTYENQINNELMDLLHQIMDIVTSSYDDELLIGLDDTNKIKERILTIVQTLYEQRSVASSRNSLNKSNSSSQDDYDKENLVLGHLENALYFIRTLSKAKNNDSPLKDEDLKELINKQCKEIEEYLKKSSPEKVASIFEGSSSPESLIQEFYSFVDKEQCNESPIRELFTLFTAAVEVNKIIFERNHDLETEYQKLRRHIKQEKDKIVEMQKDNDSKTQIMNQLKERISQPLEHEVEDLNEGLDELFDLLASSKDIIQTQNVHNTKLRKALKNVQKGCIDTENKLKTKDKQIAQLMQKVNSAQYEREKENSELQQKYNEAKKKLDENQNLQAELERVQKKLKKYNKQGDSTTSLTQQLQESQEQNAVLQAQLAKITEQMDNYQASSDFTASTMSGYENHLSSLKGKMGGLKRRNAQLESQLHGALQDIQTRNDQIENSYKKQIKLLTEELEKLRTKYAEVKEINKQSKKWREDYYSQMAKLKVTQKRYEAEAKDAKDTLKLALEQNEARLEAQKIALQTKYEEDKKKQKNNIKKLASVVKINSDDLNELIEEIIQKYDPDLINDALESKEKLQLTKKMKISDAIEEIMTHYEELKIKSTRDDFDKNYRNENSQNRENVSDYISNENRELRRWINNLYSVLNDGEISPQSLKESKQSIENAIYGIKNPKSNERKYNILKMEKSILNRIDSKSLNRMKGQKPIQSIRPVLLSVLFSHLLQKFSLPPEDDE